MKIMDYLLPYLQRKRVFIEKMEMGFGHGK